MFLFLVSIWEKKNRMHLLIEQYASYFSFIFTSLSIVALVFSNNLLYACYICSVSFNGNMSSIDRCFITKSNTSCHCWRLLKHQANVFYSLLFIYKIIFYTYSNTSTSRTWFNILWSTSSNNICL